MTFGLFFVLYLAVGFQYLASGAFRTPSALFELDVDRGIDDLVTFGANHYRTKVHPIYVLIVNPLGSLLLQIFKSPEGAAVVLNGLIAALAVTLSQYLFFLVTEASATGILLSWVFGVTMSQFVLGGVPDTASLAIFGLIVTYTLFCIEMKHRALPMFVWIIGGLLTLGVTTTNVAQTGVCYFASQLFGVGRQSLAGAIKKSVLFGVCVVSAVILFSLVQKRIYPSSNYFFLPQAYAEERRYASRLVLKDPVTVGNALVKQFFIANVVAPSPHVNYGVEPGVPYVTFQWDWVYSRIGWVGLVLWLGYLTLGFAGLTRSQIPDHNLRLALIVCLLGNLALHSVYGVMATGRAELFNYTGNVTCLILLIFSGYLKDAGRWAVLHLALLATFLFWNNLGVTRQIMDIYR